MDELVALPVKGESFLLRRGTRYILVDGGFSGQKLAGAIAAREEDLRRIDVVVCTHGDRDHAGGLAEFFYHWRRMASPEGPPVQIGEFWLPGSWADVIPDLLHRCRDVTNGLIDELDKLGIDNDLRAATEDVDGAHAELDQRVVNERFADKRHDGDFSSLSPDELGDPWSHDEPELEARELPKGEAPWFAEIRGKIDAIESPLSAASAFASARQRVRYRRKHHKISRTVELYWLELIRTAESIRAIAEQAISHQIRIRWFDFDTFLLRRRASGGIKGFLIPINSVETHPIPRTNLTYLARLSPINEASLVFLAPPTCCRLGVVFCGDSPLGDGPRYGRSFLNVSAPLRLPVIATAPHHGAETNMAAYGHLLAWASVRLWLRTGGSARHPGSKFCSMSSFHRLCTHCPRTGKALRAASVTGHSWPYGHTLWLTGHRCSC
jgi:hypothetical protein